MQKSVGSQQKVPAESDRTGAGFYEYFLPQCAEEIKAGRHWWWENSHTSSNQVQKSMIKSAIVFSIENGMQMSKMENLLRNWKWKYGLYSWGASIVVAKAESMIKHWSMMRETQNGRTNKSLKLGTGTGRKKNLSQK